MIRSYLNEDVTRHPFASEDKWGEVTFGTDETIRARATYRNIKVMNAQGQEKVSRTQIKVVASQTLNIKDEFTVDGERLVVGELGRQQDFVSRFREVKLV